METNQLRQLQKVRIEEKSNKNITKDPNINKKKELQPKLGLPSGVLTLLV